GGEGQSGTRYSWALRVVAADLVGGRSIPRAGAGERSKGGEEGAVEAAMRVVRAHGEAIRAAFPGGVEAGPSGSTFAGNSTFGKAASSGDAAQPRLRFARVNLLKVGVDEIITDLENEGFMRLATLQLVAAQPEQARKRNGPAADGGREGEDSSSGTGKGTCFALDTLLGDVIGFPRGTDLHAHPMVSDGRLLLQDRSSCLPAHALAGKGIGNPTRAASSCIRTV
ncbi:hypothetical protein T484DRAFT_1821523, partial [Baffinella frigidus]